MIASILSVKLFSSRERILLINDSVITGAETFKSIASNTVHRPSPESETNASSPSSFGFCDPLHEFVVKFVWA